MLCVDPKMLPRLEELEVDLLARRARAETQGWLGELKGIDLAVTFLRDKRQQAQRLVGAGPVHLRLPSFPGAGRGHR
jgi:hypothetical protein